MRLRGLDPDRLADCLEQVVEHTGADDDLPFLTTVHLRLGAGRMYAMATDRYTGAIAAMPVRTSETARITIPGDFARRVIGALRPTGDGCDQETPDSVDLTITPTLLGLTIRRHVPATCWCDGGYGVETARLAVRLDPYADTLDLPGLAARTLAEPGSPDPVRVDAKLLARFCSFGPVLPLDPATGRFQPADSDLTARYAVHSTGRVIVLTRPDFLGFIATCRTDPKPDPQGAALVKSRTAWRHNLAQIA